VDRSAPGVIVITDGADSSRDAVATGTISITGHPAYPGMADVNSSNIVPLHSVTASISQVIHDTLTVTTVP
jgi:hypothetical protein